MGQIFESGTWQPPQVIMTSGNRVDLKAEYTLAMDSVGVPLAIY
jgi:hypothetical protein